MSNQFHLATANSSCCFFLFDKRHSTICGLFVVNSFMVIIIMACLYALTISLEEEVNTKEKVYSAACLLHYTDAIDCFFFLFHKVFFCCFSSSSIKFTITKKYNCTKDKFMWTIMWTLKCARSLASRQFWFSVTTDVYLRLMRSKVLKKWI